jgi:cyclopropane-fatty-acyl-phospholipid synthase
MFCLLDRLLGQLVCNGTLRVIDPTAAVHLYGNGEEPNVAVRIQDARLERQLVVDPELALGEGYMDGRLTMEQGRIYDLLELLLSNAQTYALPGWSTRVSNSRSLLRRLSQRNYTERSRRNVAHHYDINGTIYDLFLDRDRQYSCGYFTEGADLEEAQLAKTQHLAVKLAVEPGQRVLDIGSGWADLVYTSPRRQIAT